MTWVLTASALIGDRHRQLPPLVLGVLALSLCLPDVSLPQSRPYYNITKVEAKRLRNAVIVTLKGDGAMTDTHSHDYLLLDEGSPRPLKEIEIHCSGGKSQVGDFVDVSMYPVSHVEIEPRPYSNDGIGLILRVNLYTEARVRHFRTERFSGDWPWDPTMGCCFDVELGRDQQSVVITVISDRFGEAAVQMAEPETQEMLLEPGADGTYSLWTLNLDLRRLAEELGRQTGARIVVDESVRHYVTVHLPEMTVRQLLDAIAAGYGLALEEKDGRYLLSRGLPYNVATYETNVTQVVELNYLSAEAALDLLPNFLLAYAKPSEAQNALIVAGPQQLVRRVREDVAKIDRPPRQLRIEVTAVKVASSRGKSESLRTELASGATTLTLDTGSGAFSFELLDTSEEQVRARLRALEQCGKVSTLGKAHITLINGKWARLFLGEKQYIQVTRHTQYGDEQTAIPVNLGVEVRLGAWTGGEGIALWLRPVVTTLGGQDPITNLPIVDRYETRGAIIVPDGHTLLLGGVQLDSRSSTARRLLRLGPRDQTKAAENAEIALFVTARDLGESAADDAQQFSAQMADELREAGIRLDVEPLTEPASVLSAN